MPAHTKPLDWDSIRTRFHDGESATSIARDFDITRQGILKRAKKEDWLGKGVVVVPATQRTFPVAIDQEYTPEATWHRRVEETETGQWLVNPRNAAELQLSGDKRSVGLLVKLLLLVDRAVPPSVAAKRHRINPDSLTKWRRADSGLDDLFQAAAAGNACRRIVRVDARAAGGDIGSDKFLIERSPETREEFAKAAGDRAGKTSGPIHVTFNLSPPKPPVVDVTPGDRWKHGPTGATIRTLPDRRTREDD